MPDPVDAYIKKNQALLKAPDSKGDEIDAYLKKNEKYVKTGSGPWEKTQTVEVPKTVPFTALESGALGAAQGASLGYADEVEATAKTAYDVATGPSKLSQFVEKYRENREPIRARYEKGRQDNPASYTTGEVTGSVASSAIPGLNAAKGAGLAIKLGKSALTALKP